MINEIKFKECILLSVDTFDASDFFDPFAVTINSGEERYKCKQMICIKINVGVRIICIKIANLRELLYKHFFKLYYVTPKSHPDVHGKKVKYVVK